MASVQGGEADRVSDEEDRLLESFSTHILELFLFNT